MRPSQLSPVNPQERTRINLFEATKLWSAWSHSSKQIISTLAFSPGLSSQLHTIKTIGGISSMVRSNCLLLPGHLSHF